MPGAALSAFGHAMAWSLAGACAGFSFFNFPPAKIFMGDSGSTVLGFSVAFLGLDFMEARGAGGATGSLLFPFIIAALPILDALLVVARRVARGKSPLQADREHFYAQAQVAGDLAIGQPFGDQAHDVFLALGEEIEAACVLQVEGFGVA